MTSTTTPSTLHRILAGAAAIALSVLASGCSWIYPHRVATSRWVLYSDQGGQALENASDDIDRIFDAFDLVFELPPERLGVATILLDGDPAGVTDHRYSPELLGYYVPLFELVCVDTRSPLSRRPEGLRQILSHEIAHHFLACEDAEIAERCWLNEGLAGVLETAIVDAPFPQFPLLHPILYQLTRRYLAADAREGRIAELIRLDWDEFHAPETRERNYAFAWSLAYFFLEHSPGEGAESTRASKDGDRDRLAQRPAASRQEKLGDRAPLGERIRRLKRLSDAEIIDLEADWRRFFEARSLSEELLRLAFQGRPRTARWALEQIGELSSLESAQCLEGLLRIADRGAREESTPVWLAFLGVLSRTPHATFLAPRATREGLERIRLLVSDESFPPREKARVFGALTAYEGALAYWAPSLLEALSEPSANVRIAAVEALARLAWKPTILNPSFWRDANEAARAAEIDEWKGWLDERGFETIRSRAHTAIPR